MVLGDLNNFLFRKITKLMNDIPREIFKFSNISRFVKIIKEIVRIRENICKKAQSYDYFFN